MPDILPKRLEVILSTFLERAALPTSLHRRRGDSGKAQRDLRWFGTSIRGVQVILTLGILRRLGESFKEVTWPRSSPMMTIG